MKKFIILTAISEGLTGIALIAIPNIIILFLLGKPTNGPEGKITAMMAGAAILSLAIICWILRDSADIRKLVNGLLFYNCVIIAIAIYAMFGYDKKNIGLWFVVTTHTILSVWGLSTLLTKRFSNVL